jgi:hypothetical protein
MAEFKLGRIRFVWKGPWVTGTSYIPDDVISYSGKTYICVVTHTASAFDTDLTAATPKWDLMADGVSWRGNWTAAEDYATGDIVRYGGITYICITTHTSDTTLEADQTPTPVWEIFATSFDWQGDWDTDTDYKLNDVVKFGGYSYVCNTVHTSAALATGFYTDESKWDILNAGFEYKTTWADATYYKKNDVVKFGADLWICTIPHTSSTTLNTTNFTILVNGLQFEGVWTGGTTYQVGDIVTYGGYSYVALQNHSTTQVPSTATTYWSIFTTGLNFQGDYLISTDYRIGDVVRHGGYTYLAVQDTTGNTPPSGPHWTQLNSGLKWRNISVAYTNVASSNLVATGSGSPTFNVTRNNAVYAVTIGSTAGTGYTVGDTLRILGTAVGGQSPVNNITVTVATISGGGATGPIATVTATGVAVTWNASTSYILGDIVLYGANSYICVNAHSSSTGNRPDVDTTGTYWNLLTAGAELAQLTTTGDTFYYSSSGPSRLPVGREGQILRVSDGLPSWGYFGQVNNLIYVSPQGNDRPDFGSSPENPLRTVRYACGLVEHGYLNQSATALLTKNKQYILKEVNNYVKFTYSRNIGATTISSDGSRPNQLTLATLATVAADSSAGMATVTFATQTVPPYAIGETIVIEGVSPNPFNGSWTVTGCTTSAVYFDLAGTNGPQTVAGTVSRSTSGLTLNMPISFSASANGIVAGTTYYVKAIADATHFTVSAIAGGTVLAITATGAVSIVGTFAYDETKTERDAGYVLDGAIHDIGHGGTLRTTTAARAYFDAIGTDYVNATTEERVPQFISALDYLHTIATSVLNNTTTTNNYQLLNSQPATASQIIDATLTADTGSATSFENLVSIVTNSLTAGTASEIPTAIQPNTTISVKTGTYTEVLPIVVPRNTAIVGDELRSTVVQPQPAIAALSADKAKTISALNRIKAVVPDLIANSTITATTGNTEDQITSLPAGSVGSTAATTAVETSSEIIYDIVDNGLGSVPAFVFGTPTGYNTDVLAGFSPSKAQIVQNYQFIKDEVSDWLAAVGNGYSAIWTALGTGGQANCQRDVGYILDALQHDMTYGGNGQTLIVGSSYYSNYVSTIASTERAAILGVYTWLKSFIDNIVLANTAGWTKTTASSQVTSGTAGTAVAGKFAQNRIQDIIDWITNGVGPADTTKTYSHVLTAVVASGGGAACEVVYTTPFSGALGDAVTLKLTSPTGDWAAVNGSILYVGAATATSATTESRKLYWDSARTDPLVITSGGFNFTGSSSLIALPNIAYAPARVFSSTALITAFDALQAKRTEIQSDTTAWVKKNYQELNFTETTCYRDAGLIVDALSYDTVLGTNFNAVTTGRAYLRATTSALIVIANQLQAELGAINFIKYKAGAIAASGATAQISAVIDNITAYITGSTMPEIHGTVTYNNTLATIKGAEILRANTTFLANEATAWIADQFPGYVFDAELCRRDMEEYVNALVYDLQYTGNYRALRAAKLYVNAVDGSLLENMFLVRNGSGLRNMTLSGLTGTLSAVNVYGTKRPTAGAYSSLDEGFGPNDTEVWINSRSCYTQNLTMFGFGCSGMKIDAALHNGGNKSIVANDYTTIISDGIGVWCTGSGALTELISVFAYYSYSGYLSELGGRIRAANGNSSYGTYGVIAEGTDTYEVPITATIDNRYYEAQITAVNTDGIDEVLNFEFSNAGTGYTNTVHSISGSGFNATAIADEFRDASVFQTRLIDNNDSSTTSVGGTNYVTQSNASQTGDVGEITIANTDTALSSAYTGMRIQIVAGTGVGQFANILNYNNGNKIALITKNSFTTLTVTAATNTGDNLTVASTATLYANMPIYLGTSIDTLSANTLYYVKTIASATTFTVSLTSGGTAITIDNDLTGLTVSLYAAGWDHVIPGTTIENTLDLTTTYNIEPRIQYTAPGYRGVARSLSATATWQTATYGAGKFIAVANGGTSASQSSDGKTWASAGALATSTGWTDVVYVGGQGATATAVVGGLGGSGAVLTAVLGYSNALGLPQADQLASITIVEGGIGYTTPPTIVITSGSGANATATCTVRNGAIVSATVTVGGSGYLTAPTITAATSKVTSIIVNTAGKDYMSAPTVTLSSGGASVQATATATLINQGVLSIAVDTAGTGYTSAPTVTIVDANAKFIAISASSNNVSTQTVAGLVGPSAWTAGASIGKTDLAAITYGNGIAVAVGGTTGTESVVSSDNFGTSWTDRSATATSANDVTTGKYTGIAYGNGVFVAVNGGGGNKSTVSTNGTTVWAAGGTIPFTTAISVTYGNGRFVILGSAGEIAYSVDKGTTWTAAPTAIGTTTSVLSSSYTWTNVKYGQGLFMAVSQGTVGATSPDGINWTVRTLPTSTNWKGLAFGNPSNIPTWVAVSSTSSTSGASFATGATAQGRMKVVSNVVTEIRMTEPGSGYPKGTVTQTTGGATDSLTTADTSNLVDSQPIEFTGLDAYGLTTNTIYYVIGATIVTDTSFKVSLTSGSSTPVNLTSGSGLSGTYRAGPIITQTDPNKVKTAATRARLDDGALANPSFSNRGSGNTTATATTLGDGYSDLYQNTTYVNITGLYTQPTPGANIQFGGISDTWYKLVSVTNVVGSIGNYTATFQINPGLTTKNAPVHGTSVTTRLKYSQVRLTGHDFLYIGTGNQADTNYPFVDPTMADQNKQTAAFGGGRVFFTSTDQDGNFNVGNLFGVQQATGTATLNASAFNLAGLQSLQLGAVTLGVGSAIINQFSTDPYFTANSDSILPTQKAIKAYITSQIGGGASTLNVNTLTSGVIYIAGNTITTTSGVQINITSKMNFTGGIDGAPVALAYFTQK